LFTDHLQMRTGISNSDVWCQKEAIQILSKTYTTRFALATVG